jgi:predicted DNA repair protein MutK
LQRSKQEGLYMAGAGLLALLDDITTMLDDIAVMTKVAATKAVTVVGDDLAVGAEQVSSGVARHREIPIVRKVAMGSLKNKLILTPITIGVSLLSMATGFPIVIPLLAAGGTFLCHESFEKIAHRVKYGKKKEEPQAATKENLEAFEKKKVKGAIKTDFVLSSEIMLLTLGAVAAHPLLVQAGVLVATGVAMTALVYGLVAGIVKLDDLGLLMIKKKGNDILSKSIRGVGMGLIKAAPRMMKVISFTGTAAMFLVGGGILMHNIPLLAGLAPHVGGFLGSLATGGTELLAGLVAGAAAFAGAKGVKGLVRAIRRKFGKPRAQSAPKAAENHVAPAPEENRPALGPQNTISPAMSAAAAKKETGAPQAGQAETNPVPVPSPKTSQPLAAG